MADQQTADIRITPFTAALGALVECGAVRKLEQRGRHRLLKALSEHLVLVIQGQRLDAVTLLELTTVFGTPTVAAVTPKDGVYQDVTIISNVVENGKPIGALGSGEVNWHSDHSFQEEPLGAALLYAVEVPAVGGDTHFANMYLALESLEPKLRRRIELLTIKNDGTYNSAGERRTDQVVTDVRVSPGVSHPIIRTHATTGLDCLYLGRRRNAYVNGLSLGESESLLDQLWAHATQEAFIWSHRWAVGDVVVWDNRCTMHRRGDFDPRARRVMHRGQCAGERPSLDAHARSRGSHARGRIILDSLEASSA